MTQEDKTKFLKSCAKVVYENNRSKMPTHDEMFADVYEFLMNPDNRIVSYSPGVEPEVIHAKLVLVVQDLVMSLAIQD